MEDAELYEFMIWAFSRKKRGKHDDCWREYNFFG